MTDDRHARFWRKPRWMVAHGLIAVAVIAFFNLGLWQVRRLQGRLAQNAATLARVVEAPRPVTELLRDFDPTAPLASPSSLEYRPARVTGRFDPEHEVLLRFRTHAGDAGYEVLTPLLLEDGRALLVNRGWVPYQYDTPPVAAAAPPAGEVTVVGLLRAPQPAPSAGLVALAPRDPPEGPLTTPFYADPGRLAAQMPYPLVDATLTLLDQAPAQAGALPVAAALPELDAGSHLGYAIQWFAFTAIALVGYALLLRRTAKDAAVRPGA